MCIIIAKKKGVDIPLENLQESFRSNSDGAGYMFHNGTGLIIKKPFFSWNEFIESYNSDYKEFNLKDKEIVVHMRITTSGLNDKLNTHPHRLSSNVGMVHNGVLKKVGDKLESDTVWLKKLLIELFDKDVQMEYISDLLLLMASSNTSKFVFLDGNGFTIFNEDLGHWKDEIWYSNKSYEVRSYYTGKRWNAYGHNNKYFVDDDDEYWENFHKCGVIKDTKQEVKQSDLKLLKSPTDSLLIEDMNAIYENMLDYNSYDTIPVSCLNCANLTALEKEAESNFLTDSYDKTDAFDKCNKCKVYSDLLTDSYINKYSTKNYTE